MRMDILIVEDQRRIAEGLSVMLSSCKEDGIQIERTLIADNGVQALKMLEQQPVDLLITDIRMPIMDGLDAARTIRALPREDAASIPIFALSASVFAEDVERSLCSGMNGHLGKPVDIDQICSMLQTWLYPQQTDTQEQA